MILFTEYFQDSQVNHNFTPTALDYERCDDLLTRVNALFEALGQPCELRSGHRTRAKTLELIESGHRAALGGAHETSEGVDVSDPDNMSDREISDELLEQYGLYREEPESTDTWVHLQIRAPKSGHRTFRP